ncbi:exonuclease domain-containing protein [uncultured Rhodoblastus sp.]|uniref:exonuclease domain-containing protein n=1 Tax=uncultured Rhodoblastus sp. TaxID=543037 RepID=UPI0025DE1EFC|nr:exonuclease domain-containing protein [uncultured Rhodoblastus sp.]
MKNYVFYDTETTGTLRGYDQILQVAAIRTNCDFNVIDKEEASFNIRCRRLSYQVPSPGALLVTNLEPHDLEEAHLSHYELVQSMRKKFVSWSPACFTGFNSIGFDEILIRQAFYQTLHPIYLTQFSGNTRADAYLMAQAIAMHAPSAIRIGDAVEGSFRLGNLAAANGVDLQTDAAHEAMADAKAALGLMRVMRDRAPALFARMMLNSDRNFVVSFITDTPVFQWSAVFGRNRLSERVTYVGAPPSDRNLLILFNLSFDPDELFPLSDDALANWIYGPVKAFRRVRANAFPIILPLEFPAHDGKAGLPAEAELYRRAAAVAANAEFRDRVIQILERKCLDRPKANFVEDRIYDEFITPHDARLCCQFHLMPWENRLALVHGLDDERLRQLATRLIFVERPDCLPENIRSEMISWELARIEADGEVPWLSAPAAIDQLRAMWRSADPAVRQKLEKLAAYIGSLRSLATQKPHVISR